MLPALIVNFGSPVSLTYQTQFLQYALDVDKSQSKKID